MNGVKANILSQMMQLIINTFEAKPHPQKDMKSNLMIRSYRICDNILPKNDKKLLDGIPYIVPNYMNEDKTKDESIELNCMLYIYVKEIVSNYTTYFLCAEDFINNKYAKSET